MEACLTTDKLETEKQNYFLKAEGETAHTNMYMSQDYHTLLGKNCKKQKLYGTWCLDKPETKRTVNTAPVYQLVAWEAKIIISASPKLWSSNKGCIAGIQINVYCFPLGSFYMRWTLVNHLTTEQQVKNAKSTVSCILLKRRVLHQFSFLS